MHRHLSVGTLPAEPPLPRFVPHALAALGRVISFLAIPVLAEWRLHRQRQSIGALRSLDDRALKDMGIHRSEIPMVVMGQSGRRGH